MTATGEPLLSIERLTIDIPLGAGTLHAVRGVDFELRRGETLCIVGESGSGKSLTSLAIMGLLGKRLDVKAAKLMFAGKNLASLTKAELRSLRGARMAMIFQEPMTSLNPAYTIGNQLAEALILHRKVSKTVALRRAVELLDKVGITAAESRLRQYPHQLSGGLRQRVMIAMALMCEPELVIADEPTTALDVTIQAQILRLLADLKQEMNLALIFVTHDLSVVARIADKVAVMYAGEIVEAGTAAEIFANPAHPYTRGLIRCIPGRGKTKPGEPLGTIPGIVPSLIGGIEGCAFRDRCELSREDCLKPVPERSAGGGHRYRCVRDTVREGVAP